MNKSITETLNDLISEGYSVKSSCIEYGEYDSWISGATYVEWISTCLILLDKYFDNNPAKEKFIEASKSAVGNGESYFDTMIGSLQALVKISAND